MYQRFSACCKYLSSRKSVFPISKSTELQFQGCKHKGHGLITRVLDQKVPYQHPDVCYSTNVRPHLSKSLHKWKRRKRKSKAQQKRELEKLQNDFTKLLTKRAVQLMQEQSFESVYRQVVTTHSFTSATNQPNTNIMEVLATELESLNNLECDNFKVDDDFSKRVDARMPDISQFEDSFDSKYFHNLLSLPQLAENPVRETTNKQQKYVADQRYVNSLVENYLKSKDHKAAFADITSGLSEHSTISQPPTAADMYPVSHNQSLNTNYNSSSHLENSVSKLSSTSQRLNEFLDLFSTFQAGMVKSGHDKRNWEKHDENDQESLTAGIDPAGETSAILSAVVQPQPLYASASHQTKTLENALQDEADRVHRKDDVSISRKDEQITTSVKPGKKQEEKEYKSFKELIDPSFIEACCFTGNELLAVRNIEFQSRRHGITSVGIFNRLIHALAKKQNLDAIKSLFSLLRQGDVSPSLQSYAGCLECIGRMANPDTFLCERLLADIEKVGFDLKEIANTCSFECDELDFILKAIHLVNPDFVPNDAPPASSYTSEMLLSLESKNPNRVEKNQYAFDMEKSEIMIRLQRQIEMEKSGVVMVPSVANQVKSNDHELNRLREEVKNNWHKSLCNSFTEVLRTFEKKAKNSMNMTIFPYLKLFPPEMYVNVIFKCMQDLLSLSEAYSLTQIKYQYSMGNAVNRMYNIESRISAGMADKVCKLYDQYADDYLNKDLVLDNHRKMWSRAMARHWDTVNMDLSMKKWPRRVTKSVGKILLGLILYDLKIDANLFNPKSPQQLVPAFCTIYRPDVTTFTMAEIKVHPVVSKLFKMDCIEEFQFDPSTVPMLVPPIPWVSMNMGGLLLGAYSLIRKMNDLDHLNAWKDVKDTQFISVLDSLNTLSACAWKMNKPILDLQIQIFKANGDANLKVSPPSSILPPLPVVKAGMTGQEKAALYRQRVSLQHQKQDMHGLWCSDLYRLSIANKFRDEIFWFPHSMDFRGRTYPLPPHFNHLGSDNVRGMLLFAKGKPLGPNGHDWLKIHLINLTGLKKRSSNEDRLAYANTLMDDILDSAENPLTGKKWWQSSDEPWQTLACCTELAKIERFEGNKEEYICHFPVHQDGSCNGLQHYAALGRDQAGAESVNLVPFDTPQDVYSDVVELVERQRQKDAEGGHDLAKALEGFVKRKVIKQTIMTTVYGVTRFGAKAQIHKQLKDIPEFPPDLAWAASLYLTERTFSSLREMFSATKDIQDWLTEAAQLISAFKPVDWVTPLGFPVAQPYFKQSPGRTQHQYSLKPNTVKQKNALPPNYIHSLDSTHMMLTSLYCMHEGITFVSVHDCFWTHACDISIMNKVCREQFVSMHNQPLLDDLSRHLVDLVHHASLDSSLKQEMGKVDISSLKSLLSDVPKRGDVKKFKQWLIIAELERCLQQYDAEHLTWMMY